MGLKIRIVNTLLHDFMPHESLDPMRLRDGILPTSSTLCALDAKKMVLKYGYCNESLLVGSTV